MSVSPKKQRIGATMFGAVKAAALSADRKRKANKEKAKHGGAQAAAPAPIPTTADEWKDSPVGYVPKVIAYQDEVRHFYMHNVTQLVVAGLIIVNFFINIAEKEVDPSGENYPKVWSALEDTFNALFLVELIMNWRDARLDRAPSRAQSAAAGMRGGDERGPPLRAGTARGFTPSGGRAGTSSMPSSCSWERSRCAERRCPVPSRCCGCCAPSASSGSSRHRPPHWPHPTARPTAPTPPPIAPRPPAAPRRAEVRRRRVRSGCLR